MPFVVPFGANYSNELKTLGDHLRKRRLDVGLLQQDVALQMGVHEDSVCHWENGRSKPKPYLVPRVIAFLGYAPWEAPGGFGGWLVMARQANGLSRKRLARKLGVDQSTVFRWESDRGHPGPYLLTRVKAAVTGELRSESGTAASTE